MKIRNLVVAGFRGFNAKCDPIEFHEKLTLVAGANSYGKTSISEALEWLLYGVTSKVEDADAKSEYKGSYRNCHFPQEEIPFVEATFLLDDGIEVVYKGELTNEVYKKVPERYTSRRMAVGTGHRPGPPSLCSSTCTQEPFAYHTNGPIQGLHTLDWGRRTRPVPRAFLSFMHQVSPTERCASISQ